LQPRLPDLAVAALAGGLMWIAYDILQRLSTFDLSGQAVYSWIFRLFLCVPLAWAIAFILNEEVSAAAAFLMGAFPTETILAFSRRVAATKLGLGEEAGSARSELLQIQGINNAHLDRLAAANITTVLDLAYCDPIELSLRTNIEINVVMDWKNQAVLWVYIDHDLKAFKKFYLRGAQEVYDLLDYLESTDGAQQEKARTVITALSERLKIPAPALETVLDAVALDTHTLFMQNFWCWGYDTDKEQITARENNTNGEYNDPKN
jgi:hypothetical protein